MTTQADGFTRQSLESELALKKVERDETASRVRSEPEARKELRQLNAEIAEIEGEIQNFDAAERGEEQRRKAAAFAEEVRRRELAAQGARGGLGEYERRSGMLENFVALAAQEARALLALEADIRRQGYAAILGAEARDAFQMACTPLLTEREIAELLAEVPKGRFRTDLAFSSKVKTRVREALAQLPGRTE